MLMLDASDVTLDLQLKIRIALSILCFVLALK